MPSKKKLSFVGQEVKTNTRKKVPTLRQYLKELPKDVENITSTVHIIWLPGQWKNVTLQTHDFRIIIDEDHPFYADFTDRIDEITIDNQTLVVTVTDRKSVSYRLDITNSIPGEWFFIGGNAGVRYETDVQDSDEF